MRRGGPRPLVLHADRFFDSDPEIRRAARGLYEETREPAARFALTGTSTRRSWRTTTRSRSRRR